MLHLIDYRITFEIMQGLCFTMWNRICLNTLLETMTAFIITSIPSLAIATLLPWTTNLTNFFLVGVKIIDLGFMYPIDVQVSL